jgi:hypothetical protein
MNTQSPPSRIRHCSAGRPRGAALIVAIVCLAIASALLISVARLTVIRRGAAQGEQWRVQACWLADSALDRAAARLRVDAQYRGETWKIPAESLGGPSAGAVRIEVEAVADQPNARLARVVADYPDDPQRRARKTKEAILRLPITNLTGDKP